MNSDQKIERLTALRDAYDGCSRCGLCDPRGRSRANVVFGGTNVDADVMIIGEGPGAQEDENGVPFWAEARSGEMVDKFLASMNSSREEVWIDNMVMCRATSMEDPDKDRPPSKTELAACRDRLSEVIHIVDPKVILLLGRTALKLAKKWGDYEDKEVVAVREGITSIVREPDPRRLALEVPGSMSTVRYTAFATFHPAYLLRLKEADLNRKNSDLEMAWRVWRHAFRMADSFNYIYEGTVPPQRGVDVE